MGNNKWGINSEKQNSHSINNNFQLNSNFHNYFNSTFFSISSNTHSLQNHIFLFLLHSILTFICFHFSLFLLFIVIVVPFSRISHYCIKWINVIDMPFFTHFKQTHWRQVLYSFKHVLWQLYTQNDISFQNHIHHLVLTIVWEKEKNQQHNNHVMWNNDLCWGTNELIPLFQTIQQTLKSFLFS